jgi:hypothetical protein
MIRLLHHGTGFGEIALRVDVVVRARKIAKDGASSHASPALTSMRMFGDIPCERNRNGALPAGSSSAGVEIIVAERFV